jgi:hypothetical protein
VSILKKWWRVSWYQKELRKGEEGIRGSTKQRATLLSQKAPWAIVDLIDLLFLYLNSYCLFGRPDAIHGGTSQVPSYGIRGKNDALR